MTAGHRHREKLNTLAFRLEERAKPYETGDKLLRLGFMVWVFIGVFIHPKFDSDFIIFIFLMGLFVVMMVLSIAGSKLTDLARRLRVETATEKLRRDQRPPVLYLRSFNRDAEASKIYRGGQEQFSTVGMLHTTTGSEEELIVKFFDRVGPVIAIGNPSDTEAIIGAARYYLDGQEKWTEVVEKLLDKSAMVILHAGLTDGLLWEIETVIRKVSPWRLLLLLSFTETEYSRFRMATATAFPSPLPGDLEYYLANRAEVSSIKAVITFDATWTSHLIGMPSKFQLTADGASYLKATLPKVFGPFLARLEAARNPTDFQIVGEGKLRQLG